MTTHDAILLQDEDINSGLKSTHWSGELSERVNNIRSNRLSVDFRLDNALNVTLLMNIPCAPIEPAGLRCHELLGGYLRMSTRAATPRLLTIKRARCPELEI